MPRALVLGNGNLLATFDDNLLLRDLYYPHVGLEDHTKDGDAHLVGFFVDGRFSWLHEGSWSKSIAYGHETMAGDSLAENRFLELSVRFQDFVSPIHDILVRKLTIKNTAPTKRTIKVFFHHDFQISGDKTKDTAQYEPELNGVLHYRGERYFFVSGQWQDGQGMDQFTIGKSKYRGKEGTYRDAEDGILQGNPIDQGSVDATVGFMREIDAGAEAVLYLWLVAGKKYEEIRSRHNYMLEVSPARAQDHTERFWREWVNKENRDFDGLPPEIVSLYKKSLLIIRTQIDNDGAILAANDSDIMKTNRDNYSYMWPRDGAMISMTLAEAGYPNLSRKFLQFTGNLITREGYLLNKYNPDGSLGSSWHPKFKNGEIQLPIQEDESALLLVALEQYFNSTGDIEFLQNNYQSVVLPVAQWMIGYIDKKTGLPLPSYDLWEQSRGVSTYTASCVYAALMSASRIAKLAGHSESAAKFRKSAEKLQESIVKYLYSNEHGRFLKQVTVENGEIITSDATVDAAICYVWKMGVLPADDQRVQKTMQAITSMLTVPGPIGGMARFQNDAYQFDYSTGDHQRYPGNPWIITTLWKTDFEIAIAQNLPELEQALQGLLWVLKCAHPSGILPEQVHYLTNIPLSVAPLTWSHSAYVSTVLHYLKKRHALKAV